MRRILLPIFLLLLAALPLCARTPRDLARYHNQNRLLLVFAPSASDTRWARQDALLTRSRAQFSDRDLLRFDIFEHSENRGAGMPLSPRAASGLRARYRIKAGIFRVLLIGKDGHAAFGSPAPVSLRGLTERIDRMPMRRDEMRRGERQAR